MWETQRMLCTSMTELHPKSKSPVMNYCPHLLIIDYVKCGRHKDALHLYDRVASQEDCSSSSSSSSSSSHLPPPAYVALLRACAILRDLQRGIRLHNQISSTGLLACDLFIGSTMISMYAKCGSLSRAQLVFDRLPVRNVVSWNALIRGYAEDGRGNEALHYFELMKLQGISPDAFTFSSIFKSCAITRDIRKGQEFHSEIARQGLLGKNVIVGSTVVDMYAKCGTLCKAHEVFNSLPVRDTVSWTTMIGGYADSGHGEEALQIFERMQSENILPDAATFVCCFKACGSVGAIEKGQQMHTEVARNRFLEKNKITGSSIVDMYVKCGFLTKAREVFDKLLVRNVVCWTTLITGYVEHGHSEEALDLFEQMRSEGISPNSVTYVTCLRACGSIEAIEKGRIMHDDIERTGLLESDGTIGNALVDMYAKAGSLTKAQDVFDKLPIQSVFSWNALISGYVEYKHEEAAVKCFTKMKLKGISPDAVTFVCILKACGNLGAKNKGIEIHAEMSRKGLLENDLVLANSLLDMYAKCGALAAAHKVFDKLPVHDIFSCNSLIAGYARLGEFENVFLIFDRMVGEGITPGWITFLIVLNTCSRSGFFNKSKMYLEAMMETYGIIPMPEHHACIVSILCRIGELDKAVTMTQKIPSCPSLVTWFSILNACKHWGNIQLGRQAFKNVACL